MCSFISHMQLFHILLQTFAKVNPVSFTIRFQLLQSLFLTYIERCLEENSNVNSFNTQYKLCTVSTHRTSYVLFLHTIHSYVQFLHNTKLCTVSTHNTHLCTVSTHNTRLCTVSVLNRTRWYRDLLQCYTYSDLVQIEDHLYMEQFVIGLNSNNCKTHTVTGYNYSGPSTTILALVQL